MTLPASKAAEAPDFPSSTSQDSQASPSKDVTPSKIVFEQSSVVVAAEEENNGLVAQLDMLISLVATTKTALQTLATTVSDHEARVSELKKKLAKEVAEKDEACRQSDKFATAIRSEEGRLVAAETRALAAVEKFKTMRRRETDVRERIDRLTADIAAFGPTGPRQSPQAC